jgi:hypothetical protein
MQKYFSYILNSPDRYAEFTNICSTILEELRQYPALVSNFKVSQDFLDGGVSFTGPNNLVKNSVGFHAMLLIGGRVKDGKYFFLLQNWWENRSFIEVSAEYMQSAEPTISFVEQEIIEIPSNIKCTDSPYAETISTTKIITESEVTVEVLFDVTEDQKIKN